MMKKNRYKYLLFTGLLFTDLAISGQNPIKIVFDPVASNEVTGFLANGTNNLPLKKSIPIVSYEVCRKNDLSHKEFFSTSASGNNAAKIELSIKPEDGYHPGYKAVLT